MALHSISNSLKISTYSFALRKSLSFDAIAFISKNDLTDAIKIKMKRKCK